MTHEPPATHQLYVIYENEDKTECGILPRVDWNKSLYTQLDTQGRRMKIALAFTAMSWEDAMGVYNEHYGFESYRPPVVEVKMGWKYILLVIFAVLALAAWPFLTIGAWVSSKANPGSGEYNPCLHQQNAPAEQPQKKD